jgi:hypothetical protein
MSILQSCSTTLKSGVDLKDAFEKLKEVIPASVTLCPVDYADSLNNKCAAIQEAIRENSVSPLYESIEEWRMDVEYYWISELIKDIKKSFIDKYHCSSELADAVLEEYADQIKDILYDRDDSDFISALLTQTDNLIILYDTGAYVSGDVREKTRIIFETLKLPATIETVKKIRNLIYESYEDGRLCIYWDFDPSDLLSKTSVLSKGEEDWKSISWKGELVIGIGNSSYGCGAYIYVDHELTLPFRRENLTLDSQAGRYPLMKSVYGVKSLDNIVDVTCSNKTVDGDLESSTLSIENRKEAEYIKTFKEGKCTVSDSDITRHRNVYYQNDGLSGSVCPHCKHFWID